MVKPTKVRALPGYKIWVQFSDGVQGEVDLSHLVGKGVFRHWEEKGEFEKVHIDRKSGTLAWDEEIDLCSDTLYMQITGQKPEEFYSRLKPQAAHA